MLPHSWIPGCWVLKRGRRTGGYRLAVCIVDPAGTMCAVTVGLLDLINRPFRTSRQTVDNPSATSSYHSPLSQSDSHRHPNDPASERRSFSGANNTDGDTRGKIFPRIWGRGRYFLGNWSCGCFGGKNPNHKIAWINDTIFSALSGLDCLTEVD